MVIKPDSQVMTTPKGRAAIQASAEVGLSCPPVSLTSTPES